MTVERSWNDLEMVTASRGLWYGQDGITKNGIKGLLCWPPQREICLGNSSGMVEHFQQMCLLHGGVPLLPKLRCSQDGLPRLQRDIIISCGYIQYKSVYIVPGLSGVPMNHDICELWNGRYPCLSFLAW
jgi:hypothetical protein